MAQYRIYPLDGWGHIANGFEADCPSDDAAIVEARTLLQTSVEAEIWQGTRCVGRVHKDCSVVVRC